MKSVKPQLNKMQIFKTNSDQNHSSGGKSGSFFFFTEDKQFIIKTMSQEEKMVIMRLLPSMINYLIENGCKSIISRIYGIYRVTYSGMSPIFLMLQKNNIKIQPGNSLQCLFDLKGSKFNR